MAKCQGGLLASALPNQIEWLTLKKRQGMNNEAINCLLLAVQVYLLALVILLVSFDLSGLPEQAMEGLVLCHWMAVLGREGHTT